MSRTLTNPNAGSTFRGKLPIYSGGTNEDTAPLALAALGGIPTSDYNQPGGVLGLNNTGHIPFSAFPASLSGGIALEGPELLYLGTKGIWTINNYDSNVDYTVTCTSGFVSRNEDQIHYTAPNAVGTYGFNINNKDVTVVVDDRYIAKPTITSPVNEMTNAGAGVVITANDFAITGGLYNQEVKSNTPKSDQGFGVSCAIDSTGTRMIVGAYRDPYNTTPTVGAVYIFRNDSGVWVQEAKLFGDTQNMDDLTGYSVDINSDGTRVAFGSHGVDIDVTPDCGIVYVYVRSGTTWTREAGLTALDRTGGAQLGTSVTISANGDRIIAGAPYEDNRGYGDIGSVYVFVRSGTSWTQEAKLLSPDVANSNAFGYSVSVDNAGTWLVIGGAGNDIAGVDSGVFYTYYRTGSTWNYEYSIVPADAVAGDLVGASIAISGDGTRIAIGAPFATRNGQSQIGAVWVYYKPGSFWILDSKIQPSDVTTGDNLGWGLNLNYDGTRLVVGAVNHDFLVNSGSAYVFQRVGNAWSQKANVTHPNPTTGSGFGRSAAITADGSKVVIGAIGHGAPTYNFSGAAFAFDMVYHASTDWQFSTDPSFGTITQQSLADTANLKSWFVSNLALNTDYYVRCRYNGTAYGTSEWSDTVHFKTRSAWLPTNEYQILTASDKATGDQLGFSIKLDTAGTRLVVGAHGKTLAGISASGAAYIFTRSGNTWVQEAALSASDKQVNAYFGVSVDINSDGSRVVIGAHGYDATNGDQGAAYVFSRSGTTWIQEQILVPSNTYASGNFGLSVAINNVADRIIVGAHGSSPTGLSTAGAAYVFSRSGTVWTQEAELTASDKAAGDQFGHSVCIDDNGSWLAIGSHLNQVSGISSGCVYIFSRSGTVWTQSVILSGSDKAAGDQFGVDVSFNSDGSRLAVGAFIKDVSGITDAGQVYVFSRSGTTWTEEAIITASDKAASDQYGVSTCLNSDGSQLIISAYAKTIGGVTNCGQVYIYRRVGITWTEEAKLTASDKGAADLFSRAIALNATGDILALASYGKDVSGIADIGQVYIFQ